MGKLNGRVAIVTGASRGIGAEISQLFAKEGAKIVCAARTLNEGDHRLLSGSLSTTVKAVKDAVAEALVTRNLDDGHPRMSGPELIDDVEAALEDYAHALIAALIERLDL